jgi:hypothetical protein
MNAPDVQVECGIVTPIRTPLWRYAGIAEAQERPWPSIAFGAAGVAYALWRARSGEQDPQLDHAHSLLVEAGRADDEDYGSPSFGTSHQELGPSLYYGPAGVDLVHALVAHARKDDATYRRVTSAFFERCRSHLPHEAEVLQGMGGFLNATRILHRHTGDEMAAATAADVASRLLGRVTASSGTPVTKRWAFGHGRAGILHALLSWAHGTDGVKARAVLSATAEFANTARAGRLVHRDGVHEVLRASWCNGGAGLVLLWTKAYECTGDPAYLELARREVTSLGSAHVAHGDLCCGLAGHAYAFLAMSRIETGGHWYERAVHSATAAAVAMRHDDGPWPNGLYKGYPGLACLFHDLEQAPDERYGFPLIEG